MAPHRNRNEVTTCSFCGKREEEVDKLIKGPDVNICDECVSLCWDIVLEHRRKPRMNTCFFCGKREVEVGKWIKVGHLNICDECVDLHGGIIAEHRRSKADEEPR